jgi:hypothetical protein
VPDRDSSGSKSECLPFYYSEEDVRRKTMIAGRASAGGGVMEQDAARPDNVSREGKKEHAMRKRRGTRGREHNT